jgi:hypothetical protein
MEVTGPPKQIPQPGGRDATVWRSTLVDAWSERRSPPVDRARPESQTKASASSALSRTPPDRL